MNHDRKCQVVAAYIADRMNTDDLVEYVVDDLYQMMKHSDLLEGYMADYCLTEQHLEELGGV
jgi:hypothetical protein